MANILTSLIPTMYDALDVVSRELVGFLPAVTRNSSAAKAAIGQQILVPITTAGDLIDNTPANVPPTGGDQTVTSAEVYITKSKSVPITWNGEQQLGLNNAGTYEAVFGDQLAQSIRRLVNAMEADLWVAGYQAASRAYGTPGTAPFGTAGDLMDVAQLRKILDDNGVPQSDLHLVLDSTAVVNLRGKQSMLLKANEKGSDDFRRTGSISDIPLHGFDLHNSVAVRPVTKGTGTGFLANGAVAAGVNSIVLDTGTGTVLAGDVVTFAGDTNKYVVNKALGSVTPNTLTIGQPGLINALADNTAMTVGATYTPNVAFHRSAMVLATRAPAMPVRPNGVARDGALDVTYITDPVTGLTFEVSVYGGFKQLEYFVGLAWGVAAIKPNHIATLIG